MVLNYKEIPLVPIEELSNEELKTELAIAREKLQTLDHAGGLMADFLQISKESYWNRLESNPQDKQKLLEDIFEKIIEGEESVLHFNSLMKDIVTLLPDLQNAVKYF